MLSGAYGNFAETGFDSTSIVLPKSKSKKKHQRLKDISKQISSNICSHLENPSHIMSLVVVVARLSPDGSGKLVRLQLLLGRSLAERVGGEGLAQVIRRLRPQQLLGHVGPLKIPRDSKGAELVLDAFILPDLPVLQMYFPVLPHD